MQDRSRARTTLSRIALTGLLAGMAWMGYDPGNDDDGGQSDDDSAFTSRELAQIVCDRYLGCIAATSPAELGAQVVAFGSEGTCWEGDEGNVGLCLKACNQARKNLYNLLTETQVGDSVDAEVLECSPCGSHIDCQPFPQVPFCRGDGQCVECQLDTHCSGATPVCHPRGVCGTCGGNQHCGPAAPVCDIETLTCVAE